MKTKEEIIVEFPVNDYDIPQPGKILQYMLKVYKHHYNYVMRNNKWDLLYNKYCQQIKYLFCMEYYILSLYYYQLLNIFLCKTFSNSFKKLLFYF